MGLTNLKLWCISKLDKKGELMAGPQCGSVSSAERQRQDKKRSIFFVKRATH
ncbi:MAG: hypothetical protein NC820_06100 [Candidatus Omnitrophica bacterium]|nr:hypothetical protein [Candidatus Omnitrophota bacterium]